MTIKTWTLTAESIVYGQIELQMGADNVLHLKRTYTFLDADGHEITHDRHYNDMIWVFNAEMAWADVPSDVKAALITLDTYSKNGIKTKEGIS